MKELYFATGVLVGGAISWYFTKKHYEKILKEEAKSFREALKKLRGEKEHEEVEEPEEVEAPKEEKNQGIRIRKRSERLFESNQRMRIFRRRI